MGQRGIKKQNKVCVYRFDLSFCQLMVLITVGRAIDTFNLVSLRQRSTWVQVSPRANLLLFSVHTVLHCCRMTIEEVRFNKKKAKEKLFFKVERKY